MLSVLKWKHLKAQGSGSPFFPVGIVKAAPTLSISKQYVKMMQHFFVSLIVFSLIFKISSIDWEKHIFLELNLRYKHDISTTEEMIEHYSL